MTRATLQKIEEEVERYGIVKDHMTNATRRVQWVVRCRGEACPTPPLHKHWGPGVSPEAMIKDVRRIGWLIDRGERPLCPACVKQISRKAKDIENGVRAPKPTGLSAWKIPQKDIDAAHMEIKKMVYDPSKSLPHDMKFTDELEVTDALVTAFEASMHKPGAFGVAARSETMTEEKPAPLAKKPEPNLKITRAIFDLLDECFEITSPGVGRYRNGADDGSVAKLVGTAQGVVEHIRLSMYGEVQEDVRLTTIRDDLARLERAFDKVAKTTKDDIAALRSRVEQVAAASGKGK